MTIVAVLIFIIFCFGTTKCTVSLIDFLVPYIFVDEKFINENINENITEPTEYYKFLFNYNSQIILIASYIEASTNSCINFYYNPPKIKLIDVYFYFRYDYFNNPHLFLKLFIFIGFFGIPLAIYESYEFGFPKEYLYIIPAVFYSFYFVYYFTTDFGNFIEYSKSSWLFQKNLYVPEIVPWEGYIYSTGRESYFLTKIKKFYSLISTESIDLPRVESWEDYVYESNHRSIVKRFYHDYLRPKITFRKIRVPRWFFKLVNKLVKFIFTSKKKPVED